MSSNTAEKQLRKEFDKLSKVQRQAFYSKLQYACDKDDWALFYAHGIVTGARAKGVFKNIKFGDEVPADELPEIIGFPELS